jgi:hypothetical protein
MRGIEHMDSHLVGILSFLNVPQNRAISYKVMALGIKKSDKLHASVMEWQEEICQYDTLCTWEF